MVGGELAKSLPLVSQSLILHPALHARALQPADVTVPMCLLKLNNLVILPLPLYLRPLRFSRKAESLQEVGFRFGYRSGPTADFIIASAALVINPSIQRMVRSYHIEFCSSESGACPYLLLVLCRCCLIERFRSGPSL